MSLPSFFVNVIRKAGLKSLNFCTKFKQTTIRRSFSSSHIEKVIIWRFLRSVSNMPPKRAKSVEPENKAAEKKLKTIGKAAATRRRAVKTKVNEVELEEAESALKTVKSKKKAQNGTTSNEKTETSTLKSNEAETVEIEQQEPVKVTKRKAEKKKIEAPIQGRGKRKKEENVETKEIEEQPSNKETKLVVEKPSQGRERRKKDNEEKLDEQEDTKPEMEKPTQGKERRRKNDEEEKDAEKEAEVKPSKKESKTKKNTAKANKKNAKSEGNDEELPAERSNTKPKMNSSETDWKSISFKCSKKNAEGKTPNLKITSWNVAGLRSWFGKDCSKIFQHDKPDIFCVQETKLNENKFPEMDTSDYKAYWCTSDKKGYAGVGLLTKKEPIDVKFGIDDEEQDVDGRCITAEFNDFFIVNVYVPNAGRKLVTLDKRLKWNESFSKFIKSLDEKKPVIICGDMNVAHTEIDLKNPKTNTKNAGFTQEERNGMTDFLEKGFVDTFRHLYPDKEDVYTFWTYTMNCRKKNVGWRLDYIIVSDRIKNKICDHVVYDQIFGSDHCPISLFMNI